MVVTRKVLDSYEEFVMFVEELSKQKKISKVIMLFSGAKKENGRSWCIYCQMAEPIVNSYLTEITENITFVHVNVGDRPYWKDLACPFRTDTRLKLMVIPTLIRWNTVKRLEGSQCNKRELLELVFGDDD